MNTAYTILICDDDTFISKMYAYKFELEGFKVFVVNTGDVVIENIKKIRPDIVILDLMMPNMTGFEVLQKLQEDPDETLRLIPIITSTNLAQQTDIDLVRKLNAAEFVVKSEITPSDLLAVVQKHLPTQ